MFNGLVIKELLLVQGKTEKEFAEYFWEGKHTNWKYLLKRQSVNSPTLERLCAFFKCSMDVFFTPNYSDETQNVIGSNNLIGTFNVNQNNLALEINYLRESLKVKDELVAQKDETIQSLKEQIELLKEACRFGQQRDAQIHLMLEKK